MGFRFRRSIKLGGVRFNIGKSGFTSVSVGARGFRTTFGKRGVTRTVGIPGTGMSWVSHESHAQARRSAALSETTPEPAVIPLPDRFGILRKVAPANAGRARSLLLWAGGGSFLAGLFVSVPGVVTILGGVGVVAGLMAPSRKTAQAAFDVAHNAAVSRELDTRIQRFNDQITSAAEQPERLRDAMRDLGGLELTTDDIGHDRYARIEAGIALVDFDAAATTRGRLEPVTGYEQIAGAATCYYGLENVLYDKRGENDPTGTLCLTSDGVTFLSSDGLVSTPWQKVVAVFRDDGQLAIQPSNRKTPLKFVMPTYRDALLAEYVAGKLRDDKPA